MTTEILFDDLVYHLTVALVPLLDKRRQRSLDIAEKQLVDDLMRALDRFDAEKAND